MLSGCRVFSISLSNRRQFALKSVTEVVICLQSSHYRGAVKQAGCSVLVVRRGESSLRYDWLLVA
jgi:hypothetical protein